MRSLKYIGLDEFEICCKIHDILVFSAWNYKSNFKFEQQRFAYHFGLVEDFTNGVIFILNNTLLLLIFTILNITF